MRVCTFDTETNGLLPACNTMWCAVVKDHDTKEVSRFSPDLQGHDRVTALTAKLDEYDIIIGHNIFQFDLVVLKKLTGWEPKAHPIDTLWMSRVQYPDRRKHPRAPTGTSPHSVANWGYYVGRGKVEHDDWSQYTPAMMTRCEEDVEIQVLIYESLLEEGRRTGMMPAHKMNMVLFRLLQKQEENGWYVDQEHMRSCLHMLNHWIDRISATVGPHLPIILDVQEGKKEGEYKYVKKPFNIDGSYSQSVRKFHDLFPVDACPSVGGPFSRVLFRPASLDSRIEMIDFLLAQGWEPQEWNTNNVGVRTSPKLSAKENFVGINSSIGRLVARRMQCKQKRSIIGGLLTHIREDGRIPSVVTGLAVTGRARHKIIANIPGPDAFFGVWMRKIFTVPEGRVLVGIDSKGNQIRQLAARMGDDEFTAAAIDDGVDIHNYNQIRFGVSTRAIAKTSYYGIIFGSGDKKAGKIVGGNAQAGKSLKEKIFKSLPKLKELIDDLTSRWKARAKAVWNPTFRQHDYSDGWIEGLDGRRIKVPSSHQLLVYQLQSDEAIQMGLAYCIFHSRIEARGLKSGVDYWTVCWYHDEFQVETLPAHAKVVGEEACEAIRRAGIELGIRCPHDGDYKVGKTWLETH